MGRENWETERKSILSLASKLPTPPKLPKLPTPSTPPTPRTRAYQNPTPPRSNCRCCNGRTGNYDPDPSLEWRSNIATGAEF